MQGSLSKLSNIVENRIVEKLEYNIDKKGFDKK